jgi:hypothetical protein
MIRLFINAFKCGDHSRAKELDIVLKHNLSNELINEIHIYVSDNDKEILLEYKNNPKVIINNISNGYRSTYEDYIKYINTVITSHEDLSIIANSDCYFDASLGELLKYDLHYHCVALTRWEVKKDQSTALEAWHNSQDAWIFQGRIRPILNCNYPLGTYHCDNSFAWQCTRVGYLNINPCLSIKLHHLHDSPWRNNYWEHNSHPKETVPHVTLESCNLPSKNSLITGVIHYSLFGDNPRYLIGSKLNSVLVKYVYPGFWCRFYVDESISKTLIDELKDLGSEIVLKPKSNNLEGAFWRFLGLANSGVHINAIRDVDSRLSIRDREATLEFINSEANYHTFRDHPYHRNLINGGFFSAKKPISNIEELINNYHHNGNYGEDENFLRDIIWPKIKDETMTHDTFHSGESSQYIGKFIHPSFMQYRFCVERVYHDEHIGHSDHNVFGYQPPNDNYY